MIGEFKALPDAKEILNDDVNAQALYDFVEELIDFERPDCLGEQDYFLSEAEISSILNRCDEEFEDHKAILSIE